MRVCLKEYNEALLQFSQVSALPAPDAHNIETLRCWLIKSNGGAYMIQGDGTEHWGPVCKGTARDIPLNISVWEHFVKMIKNLLWTHRQPALKGRNLDLVAMMEPTKADGFAKWIAHDFVPFHHCLKKQLRERFENLKPDTKMTKKQLLSQGV
ncbi:hypothetical protein PVAG01_07473 [Phlyctema vagabunda]|uniref:DUF6594 domain-containing protein n=1 Tax=Phlyctema vagabunda TaxID=108571 RepID=A0ABR4PCK3_9HELO